MLVGPQLGAGLEQARPDDRAVTLGVPVDDRHRSRGPRHRRAEVRDHLRHHRARKRVVHVHVRHAIVVAERRRVRLNEAHVAASEPGGISFRHVDQAARKLDADYLGEAEAAQRQRRAPLAAPEIQRHAAGRDRDRLEDARQDRSAGAAVEVRAIGRQAEVLDRDELEVDALPLVPELIPELGALAAREHPHGLPEIPRHRGERVHGRHCTRRDAACRCSGSDDYLGGGIGVPTGTMEDTLVHRFRSTVTPKCSRVGDFSSVGR